MSFAAVLEERIERQYAARGDKLGWRLLYSPASVLGGADVAFIGLNPGGRQDEPDHPSFARPEGTSAYTHERWKHYAPGEEPLQRQVRLLFAGLGVPPSAVLAGNLVPFRSPDWNSLQQQREALAFGREIWTDILAAAHPKLVISMGRDAATEIAELLGVKEEKMAVGWGDIAATRGRSGSIGFIGLPHLSRFRLFGREASRAALNVLFDGMWPVKAGINSY